MIKMIQDNGARNAIIMSSVVVFRRGVRRPPETSRMIEGRMPESTFCEGLDSKEACTRTFPEDQHAPWLRWFQQEIDTRYETTGGGLEIIADVLRELFESSQLRGSVGKVIASHRDLTGQNLEISGTSKDELRRFVRQLAVTMGFQYPDITACAAVLIIERTIATILLTGDLSELKTAQLLFGCLQHSPSVEFN